MEFLRFGSRIAGAYHGCCAIDIIQNLSVDPDAKASIQLVCGDTGTALGKGDKYFGPTYKDIFVNRLRTGTFGSCDMPNHIFLVAMTGDQITTTNGKKWLAILKENGFEFVRATDNSVYSGSNLNRNGRYRPPVYLFGLFRNIGQSALPDPFTPPKAWTSLPEPTKTPEEIFREGKTVVMDPQSIIKAGAPVIKAGTQGQRPTDITADIKKAAAAPKTEAAKPWPATAPVDFSSIECFPVCDEAEGIM
jgi:hypothetical protein